MVFALFLPSRRYVDHVRVFSAALTVVSSKDRSGELAHHAVTSGQTEAAPTSQTNPSA